MKNINEILEERGNTHGSFSRNSYISQNLKRVFEDSRGSELTPEMKEALDMIFHKIARIAVGNSFEKDHWRDIAGYAQLVVNSLEQEVEATYRTNLKKDERF